MSSFEQFEEFTDSFDFVTAADLAKQRLALEGAQTDSAKQERSKIKKKIKDTYGLVEAPSRRIFDLEVDKQRLLLQAEETADWPKDIFTKNISYDQTKELFFVRHPEKKYKVEASLGDLLADLNWGNYYYLGSEVPEEIRKQYRQAVYQKLSVDIYDQQLIIKRTELEKDQLDDWKLDTYAKVQKDLAKGGGESAGLLFEKMINNLMIKIAEDLKSWGITIERATVIEDVEEKIDFIIKLPKKDRGVGFDEYDDQEKRGIQWTLKSSKSEDFRKKQRQVARSIKNYHQVDDLILVSVPIGHDEIFSKYNKWNHQGRMPGGPENMFNPAEIAFFVAQTLRDTDFVEEIIVDGEKIISLKSEFKDDIFKKFAK